MADRSLFHNGTTVTQVCTSNAASQLNEGLKPTRSHTDIYSEAGQTSGEDQLQILLLAGVFVSRGAAGEPGVAIAMDEPVRRSSARSDEPEQRICEIDPDGVFHSHYVAVALRVLVDVHATEQAEEGNPEHEQNEAPYRHGDRLGNGRDEVNNGGQGRETSNDKRKDLTYVQEGREPYDGNGEDKLDEMQYGEEHVARSHADEPHLERRKCCDASAGQ
ncbi:hypothetical protein NPX13_g4901 [Xylaria arbuscula]|uniref:Uncharacterized protein n=1 Tax=Xylaria arbuscula TaxID=114810 RepID=A0A9W8NF65_9PEZI|nr:hypothetical protein NPX13_g4901 [Xylaria arbuscula]